MALAGDAVAVTTAATVAAAPAPGMTLAPLSPLSPLVEAAVRLLPGNDRCADCKAVYPQWAGVSFGVLLCLACAGKHRALGVHVSFVKSLAMDAWSATEQRALEVGGNAKWAAVCTATSTAELPIADKYRSGVAKAYKSRILLVASAPQSSQPLTATQFLSVLAAVTGSHADLADGLSTASPRRASEPLPSRPDPDTLARAPINGHAGASSPQAPPQVPPRSPAADTGSIQVKCTTCHAAVPMEQLNSHSKRCVVRSVNSVGWRKYDRNLGVPGGSLGFSLTKTKGGFAEVTRVMPGGDADRSQVLVGSFIVGLNAYKTSGFDEIVKLVNTLPRPIQFHFAFRPSISTTRPVSAISSVPEPVSVETEVLFRDPDLGCVFHIKEFRCVVKEVDSAREKGVLVGSRVVEVNGRKFPTPAEVLQAIETSGRPVRIKFYRVEGLMRGWGA